MELYDYTEFWAMSYHQEAETIRRQLGARIEVIEHVGSTAIPHIRSKPIIDMMWA